MSAIATPILLTAGGFALVVLGAVGGYVARGRADSEEVRAARMQAATNKRAAYLAATTAQEAEEKLVELRDSGEHPEVQLFDQDRQPVCENCGRQATHVHKDGDGGDFLCLDCLHTFWPDLVGVYVMLPWDDPAGVEESS